DPPHRAAALAARPGVLVDVGLVGIEPFGQGRADPLRQLRVRADHLAVLALRLALPHVQRRAPVAVARQRPVDVVLEPLAEPPATTMARWPSGGSSTSSSGRRYFCPTSSRPRYPATRVPVASGLPPTCTSPARAAATM